MPSATSWPARAAPSSCAGSSTASSSAPAARSRPAGTQATPRNLLGFKDGTANPKAADAGLMDELVWVDAEPGRARPGRSVAATWSCGRSGCSSSAGTGPRWASRRRSSAGRKRTGAPLGHGPRGGRAGLRDRPRGQGASPLDAHIRLANPRTAETQPNRILRRGYSYSRGFDGAGLAGPGAAVRVLPAGSRARLRDHPEPARRRAARGVHPDASAAATSSRRPASPRRTGSIGGSLLA